MWPRKLGYSWSLVYSFQGEAGCFLRTLEFSLQTCSSFAASNQRPAPRRTPRGQSIAHGQAGIALAQPPRRTEHAVVIVGTSPADDAFVVVVVIIAEHQHQQQSECNVAVGGVGAAVVGRLGLQHDGHHDVEELVVPRRQEQQLQEVRAEMMDEQQRWNGEH